MMLKVVFLKNRELRYNEDQICKNNDDLFNMISLTECDDRKDRL
jgi:hypothetical protein